jgi:hypothetical protein
VNQVTLATFGDELSKIAGVKEWWRPLLELFKIRPKEPAEPKVDKLVDYHFSPKAGDDRWDKFLKNVRNPEFAKSIHAHPQADEKLKQHVKSMHQMSRAPTVGKIQSSRLPGRSYEIRDIPSGLACTCPDWRFKGSVNPGYECKHIKAHQAGKVKA